MITKRFSMFAACAFLAIFAVLSLMSALRESLTYDEIVAVEVGQDAWLRQDFSRDTNVPPLMREIAVVPTLLGLTIQTPYPNIRELPARMVTIALGLMLGFAIYTITRVYFGREAGLLALFFYVFEPNILANSHYITQDIGATLLFFLTYMAFIKVLEKPKVQLFLLLGVVAGLMAASKITVVFYLLVSVLGVTVFQFRKNTETMWKYKAYAGLMIVVALFVVWSTYFFRTNVIIASGGSTERLSAKLMRWAVKENNQAVKEVLNGLHTVRVPLGDYIAVVKNAAVRSTKHEPTFFLGAFHENTKWYFMVVNALLKTPLPLTFIFFLGLLSQLRNKKLRQTMVVLLIPIASVLLVSSITKMQPWVRYVLPMYPFICMIASSVMLSAKAGYRKVLLLLLCFWYAWGSISSYPHFISYANELAGSKKTSYMRFMDSNMDMGQSLISFKHYVDVMKPRTIHFSYFGRDDASVYGFPSDFPFGSYKFNEICAFHDIDYPSNTGPALTAISLSNWYYCGYYLDSRYSHARIEDAVERSILVFSE